MNLWEIERRFWTDGLAHYRTHLHPSCVMAFPLVGVLQGDDILQSIAQGPRWGEVAFSNQHSFESDGLSVHAYSATANRADQPEYRALCTSTYMRQGAEWLLIQHQHTLLD